jgi:hypothetical protein
MPGRSFASEAVSKSTPELRGCFGALALATTNKGSLRAFRFVLSPVIASLAFPPGEAISDCFASLATAKNAAGLLRRFAPRSDKKEVLAGTQQGIPRRNRKELAATSRHVTAGSSFRPFLRHCEVVYSSPKQSHLFAPARECQLRDCFASLAMTRTKSHCEVVVSHLFCHCEPRSFAWRSSLTFRPLGGHCELVFSFAKQSQRFLTALRLGMFCVQRQVPWKAKLLFRSK